MVRCPASTVPSSSRLALRRKFHRPSCPHCGSRCTHGHGSFTRKDGTRQPRRLCCTCGRTFNQHTRTPLHYLKKRHQWKEMVRGMAQWRSLRRTATDLGVHVATAFRWRHRLLYALCRLPQPVLTGAAVATEAYIRYSEKGSRRTDGPGAYRRRSQPSVRNGAGQRPFRRMRDGKSVCVLLACAGDQQLSAIVGQGRPSLAALQSTLSRVCGAGAHLCATGLAPYAEACRHLGIPYRDAWSPPPVADAWVGERLRVRLYGWLAQLRGVATRYLHHYLTWHRLTGHRWRKGSRLPHGPAVAVARS